MYDRTKFFSSFTVLERSIFLCHPLTDDGWGVSLNPSVSTEPIRVRHPSEDRTVVMYDRTTLFFSFTVLGRPIFLCHPLTDDGWGVSLKW
jgi:hypothetical protein